MTPEDFSYILPDQAGKEFILSLMDDKEKMHLETIANNPEMIEVVKKVILVAAYYNGTLRKGVKPDPGRNAMLAIANNRGLSNEEIGQLTRGIADAVAMLDMGCSYLASFIKKEPKVEAKKNQAR